MHPLRLAAGVSALSAALGLRYLLTEPQLFVPGGWFALDGRRVLDAADSWLAGLDPYSIAGFVYSPVAVMLSLPFTAVPGPAAVLVWITGSAVVAAYLVWRAGATVPSPLRVLLVAGVVLYVPLIADLMLANVTVALVAAMWLTVAGGSLRSGIALGVLAAAFPKPLLVPFAIWLVMYRPRPAAGSAIVAVLMIFLSVIIIGPESWMRFAETLMAGGNIEPGFVGNYGLTKSSPEAAFVAAVVAALLSIWVVWQRRDGPTLLVVCGAGVFIAPYTGIYASLPLLLGLPFLARRNFPAAIAIGLTAILAAPWAVVAAPLVMLVGLRYAGDAATPMRALAYPDTSGRGKDLGR